MLIKKKIRREKKKREEDIPDSGGEKELRIEEKRKKERDVDIFYIRGKRRNEEQVYLLWNEGLYLLKHFTDG